MFPYTPCSTSSLSNELQGKFPEQGNLPLQKVIRLEKSLEEVKKDNLNLNSKVRPSKGSQLSCPLNFSCDLFFSLECFFCLWIP